MPATAALPPSTQSSRRNFYDRYFDYDGDDGERAAANQTHPAANNKRQRREEESKRSEESGDEGAVSGSDSLSLRMRMSSLAAYIRAGLVGGEVRFDGPFGVRPLLYADWVASGRSLSFIESYLHRCVLPLYANTHSTASLTGLQTSLYRREARELVGRECGAGKDDVVLFAGSGSTGAFHLLLNCLRASWRQSGLDAATAVCVYAGPYQHHSVLLPLRELGCSILHIREDGQQGGVDLSHLTATLQAHSPRYRFNLAVFSAASNVSGLLTDTAAVSRVCNEFGCVNVWDYATAAPYVDIDMHPLRQAAASKDAIILSPHKLLGGVSTPGVLLVSKRLLSNDTPSVPGGGTVFFVSQHAHRYLQNFEEREEAGTPDIVAAIRAGLVFQLKGSLDSEWRTERLQRYSLRVLERLRLEEAVVLMGNSSAPRLPIFSFLVRHAGSGLYLHPSFVSALLNDLFGIQTRSGCMCAGPYAHRCLGVSAEVSGELERALMRRVEILRPGFTRLNCHYVMEQSDVDFLCDCLSFVARDGWRLLPLYGFHVDSGEWRHRQRLHKRAGRRWLGDIDYSSGAMQYQHDDGEQQQTQGAVLSHAEMLSAARQLASAAWRSSAVSDDSVALPADVRLLRWFLLPSEAAAAMQSPQHTFVQPSLLVLNPGAHSAALADGPHADNAALSVDWDRAALPVKPSSEEKQPPSPSVHTAEAERKESSGSKVGVGAASDATVRRSPSLLSSIVELERQENSQRQRGGVEAVTFRDAGALRAGAVGCVTCPARPSPLSATHSSAISPPAPSAPAVSSVVCRHCFHAHWSADKQAQCVSCSCTSFAPLVSSADGGASGAATSTSRAALKLAGPARAAAALTHKLRSLVGRAIQEYGMIREGDRVLVGVSGGKDSLTLLHILRLLQAKAPIRFELGAVTVDPQTPEYNPRPLQHYFAQLGVTHFYESQPIVATARQCMLGKARGKGVKVSICAFCARMKRGMLYSCLRREGWNVLALGQHADDLCESLLMSAMHNGCLRTMKANYTVAQGDIRVIRPLLYVRERMTREFAQQAQLPVIFEKSVGRLSASTAPLHQYSAAHRSLCNVRLLPSPLCRVAFQLSGVLRGA